MTVRSKFKSTSVIYTLFLLGLTMLFFCRNLYLQLIGSTHAVNLFRKLGHVEGTSLTTAAFGLLILVGFIFEIKKKFTSIAITENTITYKKFFKATQQILIQDIVAIESEYEITRAKLFPNELLILRLKTGKVFFSKMYLKNFDEIKHMLKEKIAN